MNLMGIKSLSMVRSCIGVMSVLLALSSQLVLAQTTKPAPGLAVQLWSIKDEVR
ncbi:MAG: hypothetical protein HY253_08445, partial [Burkholderiales bacterium]|nr:hypothetical protein [Burkholderiales bacterium]